MNNRIYYSLFVFFIIAQFNIGLGQKEKSFSGELIYKVTKVDSGSNALMSDTSNEDNKVIIYAKDSLLKIVNFNSKNGFQECLKHLKKNKSILLIGIEGQGYAIRIDENKSLQNDSLYAFRKKCGLKKRVGGLRSKRIMMSHPMLTNDLLCLYSKKIPSKYSNVFNHIPGLPSVYYLASEEGLLRYELESYKMYDPPLSLFMIPEGYEIVTMNEFIDKVNSDN